MKENIKRLNKLLKPYWDWQIQSFDSCRLVLIGDLDLTYHHRVEVELVDVYYIQCPTYFHSQRFRLGTKAERAQFVNATLNDDGSLFCIEADEGTFYIVAEDLIIREGLVQH